MDMGLCGHKALLTASFSRTSLEGHGGKIVLENKAQRVITFILKYTPESHLQEVQKRKIISCFPKTLESCPLSRPEFQHTWSQRVEGVG